MVVRYNLLYFILAGACLERAIGFSPRLIAGTATFSSVSDGRRKSFCFQKKAFMSLRSLSMSFGGEENPDDDEEEEIFYDDFADLRGAIGNAAADAPDSKLPKDTQTALQERIRSVQKQDLQKDAQILQNWKQGNWEVRGFSLDQENADSNENAPNQRIHVCKIVPDHSDVPDRIWVGRTDGSVISVQLGKEYLTNFRSKLTAQSKGDDKISVSSELVREDDGLSPEKPFEILHQFSAHSSPISAILSCDDYLFTASENSGEIQQWFMTEDEHAGEDATKVVASKLMTDAHTDTIQCLKTVSVKEEEEASVLFSAAKDGSLALWDMSSGDLLYKCQMFQPDNEVPVRIECADADATHVYIGTTDGQVLAYMVSDLLESASEGRTSCPLPNGQWSASEEAVTSLACAGEGSLGRGSGQSTSLLLTGSADGVVKQWEVFARPGAERARLEQWPKLSTQRLPKKAHMFQGHGNPVTALQAIDATKFLSAAADGTVRAWNPTTGKEIFRMDGFTAELKSLCLRDNILVTDGMEKFVCLHDFDIDPAPEVDDSGFELDFGE